MLHCVYTVNEIHKNQRQPSLNTTTTIKAFTCKTDAVEALERLHNHTRENNPWYKVAADAILDEDNEDQLKWYSGDNDAKGLTIELRIEKLKLAKPIKTYDTITLPSITHEINETLDHVLGNGAARRELIDSVLQRAGVEYVLNRLLIDPASHKAVFDRIMRDSDNARLHDIIVGDEYGRERIIDRIFEETMPHEIAAQFLKHHGTRNEMLNKLFEMQPEDLRHSVVVEALEDPEATKEIAARLIDKLGAKSLAVDIVQDVYARDELLQMLTNIESWQTTTREVLNSGSARKELIHQLLNDNSDGSITRAILQHKDARNHLVKELLRQKPLADHCCTVRALKNDFQVADALTDLRYEIIGQQNSLGQEHARKIIASLMQDQTFRNDLSKQAKSTMLTDVRSIISSEVKSAISTSNQKRAREEDGEDYDPSKVTAPPSLRGAGTSRPNEIQARTAQVANDARPSKKRARAIEVIEVD